MAFFVQLSTRFSGGLFAAVLGAERPEAAFGLGGVQVAVGRGARGGARKPSGPAGHGGSAGLRWGKGEMLEVFDMKQGPK